MGDDAILSNCLEKLVCAISGKYDSVDEVLLKSKCDGVISMSTLASSTVDIARFPPSRACRSVQIAR